MADLTIERLRHAGEALMQEVSRALYLAHAGLAPAAELTPIYARHAAVTSRDALALTLETMRGAPDDPATDAARRLADWQAETHTARALAALDEGELAWERTAVVRTADGQVMEYGRVPIALANARDRAERLALDDARAALVARELAPLRRDRFARELDTVAALGVADGYVATFAALSGIDVPALAAACDALLRDTQPMWDDLLRRFARARLGVPVAELTRADALALFRAPEFDAAFPPGGMLATVRTQVGAMGLDPAAGGRIVYDVGEREGKRARAFCAPVRVPHEVYLVLRPHGGAGDWRTLLHELGHALHFANARADLPFEARWAGDNSVTEAYAMLFDHLLHDAGWLRRYTELDRERALAYRRSAAFEELHLLRRYAAKLRYELALYAGDAPWDALPDLYVETLAAATGFRYRAADAFVDVDPRFYSARYLRAWQLQAALAEALRDRFDEDWWRNPRAGPYMVESLFGEGQREAATALADRVAGRALSFEPVVRAVERAV